MRHSAASGGLLIALLLTTATSVRAQDAGWGTANTGRAKSSTRPRLLLGRPVPIKSDNHVRQSRIAQVRLATPQPLSNGENQSIVRAQGFQPPPPPPFPGPSTPADHKEAFDCGVVGREPGVQGFFQRCWENTRQWAIGVPAATASIFRPGTDRGIFQSDHEFDSFISPISNPFYNQDPRALTEARPIFIWQQTPNANQIFGGGNTEDSAGAAGIGVNSFLWRATLDTISFMPLASADPHGGVIITEWYEDPATPGERFKLNILILGTELRADGVRVSVFKQAKSDNDTWQDASVTNNVGRELEDKILTRARELRIQSASAG